MLSGNSDGHAKNLTLLYHDNQNVTLAPFYDLVCTRAIERIDSRLAMSIGTEFNPNGLTQKHWTQFAEQCDIRMSYLKQLIIKMAEVLPRNFITVKNQLEKEYGPLPALQRVEHVINKQCSKQLSELT